jgi:hypothetical protein
MAAKIGSFMRLLMSTMASSIAGETNFRCDGGGLEHIEVVKSSSSKKTWRGGIAIDVPSSRLLLTSCTMFLSRIMRKMNRAVSQCEQLRQRMNAVIITSATYTICVSDAVICCSWNGESGVVGSASNLVRMLLTQQQKLETVQKSEPGTEKNYR